LSPARLLFRQAGGMDSFALDFEYSANAQHEAAK